MPMRIRKAALVTLLSFAIPVAGFAQGNWNCRTDSLAGYNCASFYSGTVALSSELRGPNDLRQTRRITATVTAGRVMCRVADSQAGNFEGPGMIAVHHDAAQAAGGPYTITVWCPESDGDRPHRGSSATIEITHRQATDYGSVEGRDEHEHPDADSANGLSGRETITWSLRRS
jgi:hypothetical protein